jgi:hypothetical protein
MFRADRRLADQSSPHQFATVLIVRESFELFDAERPFPGRHGVGSHTYLLAG